MEAVQKLIFENKQPKDISGCKPGTREHIVHDPVEFTTDLFELVPAFDLTRGNLKDLRKKALETERVLANATDLDFLLQNQNSDAVKGLLETWKDKWVVFAGTTYYSLTYTCSGEVRILTWLGNADPRFGWTGDIPHCLDGDKVCDNFYVAFLKK